MEPTFSYIYSIPYIILFLIYFLLFLWENKLKKNNDDIKIIRYLGMLIFFIFFGFRGYLDTDFAVYYPMYETAPVISDSRGVAMFFSNMNEDFLLKIEPGFKVILILLKSITPDYFFLQIISSLVDVLLLNYFFKKYSPQYALSFILFFIFSGLLVEINLIRNAKSILLFIYSIQYIRERKPIQFFVCNFIGLMLHTSAIFYFPLYFFLHKKIPPFVIWISFFIGNFIYLSQFKFIGPIISFLSQFIGGSYLMMAQGYSENDLYNSGYGITFGFIERLMTFVLFYLFYNRIDEYLEDKEKLNIFYNVFFLYSITYLFLSEYSIFIDRITTLFVFSYWIIYAYIYEMLKSWFKTLFTVILFLFGLFKMYKSNNFIIRKYENILWSKPSISRAYYILGKHLDKILNPNTK